MALALQDDHRRIARPGGSGIAREVVRDQHTKPNKTEDTKVRINKLKAVWMCAAAAVLIMRGVPVVHADDADYKTMYEEQKKRSDDLEKRVGALEANTGNVALAKSDIP